MDYTIHKPVFSDLMEHMCGIGNQGDVFGGGLESIGKHPLVFISRTKQHCIRILFCARKKNQVDYWSNCSAELGDPAIRDED